jgi:hypothetical protein
LSFSYFSRNLSFSESKEFDFDDEFKPDTDKREFDDDDELQEASGLQRLVIPREDIRPLLDDGVIDNLNFER